MILKFVNLLVRGRHPDLTRIHWTEYTHTHTHTHTHTGTPMTAPIAMALVSHNGVIGALNRSPLVQST